MVFYTDSSETKAAINRIIKNAEERLILISPYLQIPDQLRDTLKDTIANGGEKGVKTILIYGKSDLDHKESEWLYSVPGLEIRFIKNLHAKCYLNENEALITSMNLYQFSMENNYEMGVLLENPSEVEENEEKKKEAAQFQKILKDVDRLYRISEQKKSMFGKKIDPIASELNTNLKPKKEPEKQIEKTSPVFKCEDRFGYCIRCGERIPINSEKPYCSDCYRKWNRWKNPNYIEKSGHCMVCGEPFDATMNKPVCNRCIDDNRTFSLSSIIRKALNL